MNGKFTLNGNSIVARVEATEGVLGTGSVERPVLAIPLKLQLSGLGQPGKWLYFRELRCRVSLCESSDLAESLPTAIEEKVEAKKARTFDGSFFLQIPLDQSRIATIERLRNGGDCRLRLDVELAVDELVEILRLSDGFDSPVFGLKEHHRLRAPVHVHIARTVWVETVLPAMSYGKIYTIELPAIPIEACAELKAAFEALQKALSLERQGLYDEAVGKCRIALEPFFEQVVETTKQGEKRKVYVLNRSWEKTLGKVTYQWLSAAFIAAKRPLNKAHHLSSTSFQQLEAQMLLTVTTALVAYAVKTRPDGSR